MSVARLLFVFALALAAWGYAPRSEAAVDCSLTHECTKPTFGEWRWEWWQTDGCGLSAGTTFSSLDAALDAKQRQMECAYAGYTVTLDFRQFNTGVETSEVPPANGCESKATGGEFWATCRTSGELYDLRQWQDYQLYNPTNGSHLTTGALLTQKRSYSCPSGFTLQFDSSYQVNMCARAMANPLVPNKVCLECGAGAGDPINPGNGSEVRVEHDGSIGGAFPIEIKRDYNSKFDAPDNEFGWGAQGAGRNWRFNFSRSYIQINGPVGATIALVQRPDGRVLNFKQQPDGTYIGYTADIVDRLEVMRDAGNAIIGWQYRAQDGTIETYAGPGRRLVSRQDRNLRTHYYIYDQVGRVLKIVDDQGRYIQIHYLGVTVDALGHVSTFEDSDSLFRAHTDQVMRIEDSAGRNWHYDYDLSARTLVSVTFPDGTKTLYHYESPNGTALLTGISYVDAAGVAKRYSTIAYDASRRATSSELTGPSPAEPVERVEIDYTSPAQPKVKRILNAAGQFNETTYTYTNVQGVPRVTALSQRCPGCLPWKTRTFNASTGFPTSMVDFANVTTNTTYTDGLLTQVTRAVGTPVEQTETRQYSTNLRVLTRVDRPGQRELYTLNGRGQVATAKLIDTATSAERLTTYTYCENATVCGGVGLLLSVDGPRTDVNDKTTYAYRLADGAAYKKGDLWTATNGVGQVTEVVAYDAVGRPLQVKDPNNVVTDYEYNTLGRLTRQLVRGSVANSEADDRITAYEYDYVGNVTKVTSPDASYFTFAYDVAHRLTDVTDRLGNTIHYSLDSAGNVIQEDTKSGGTVLRSLSRAYDTVNQMQSQLAERSPGGTQILTQVTYDANGELDKVTDPLGRVGDSDVDALGRVTQSIANSTGLIAAEKPVTTFGYDARDNLIRVTDPKGLNTTYAYNGLDDLTQLSSPDTGTTTYTYNAAGQRIGQTDANTVVSAFAYDDLGRLTAQTFAANPTQNVYFDYDWTAAKSSDCNVDVNEQFSTGRLWRIRDESGSTRYCYDRFGNLARKIQTVVGGTTLTTVATYNSAGQIQTMTYPSGASVSYVRDTAANISHVEVIPTAGAGQVPLVDSATYAPFGPIQQLTFHNGRVQTWVYDRVGGIDSLTDTGTTNGLSEDYTLDVAGNVIGLAEGGSTARTFAYDAVDRLKSQKAGTTTIDAYTYDATGNRLSKTLGTTTTTNTYAPSSHRLTKFGNQDRTYDANGNTRTLGGTALILEYNLRNRLAKVTQGTTPVRNYYYNGRGERVFKDYPTIANDAGDVQFVYDEAGHLLGEYDHLGVRIAEYVWMDDTLVGVLKAHDGSTFQYVETDALGTPRVIVNPVTNKTIWRWKLADTSFGEHLAENDPDGNAIVYNFNLRFPGQYYDGLAGINYNYFRDYDALSGRYIQSDPIGLFGGASTYGYVGAAPFTYTDPFGLDRIINDMDCGCTAYLDDDGWILGFWPSRNNVVRGSKAEADAPYHSDDVYPVRGPYKGNSRAFGPNWILKTDDGRGRWVHGGGSGLKDPSAPYQGWKPTYGCTRMQNADIQDLVDMVRAAKAARPGKKIPYDRVRGGSPEIQAGWMLEYGEF